MRRLEQQRQVVVLGDLIRQFRLQFFGNNRLSGINHKFVWPEEKAMQIVLIIPVRRGTREKEEKSISLAATTYLFVIPVI